MITNIEEFLAAIRYAARWADLLEGMRLDAQERDPALFATLSAGPLGEIRRAHAEIVHYIDSQAVGVASETGDAKFRSAKNPSAADDILGVESSASLARK